MSPISSSQRPNVTRVVVVKYRPLHTGQDSLWALRLENENDNFMFRPPHMFTPDVWNPADHWPWKVIHYRLIANRDPGRALYLLEEKMHGPLVPGDNSQDWVTSSKSLLSASCSLDLDFGVADYHRCKKGEVVAGHWLPLGS